MSSSALLSLGTIEQENRAGRLKGNTSAFTLATLIERRDD